MRVPVYLICGDDDFLVEEAARKRINELLPAAEQENSLEKIDGHAETGDEANKRVLSCLESVQTPGFFGSAKVTWFRDVNFLTGSGERVAEGITAKAAVEQLAKWIASCGTDAPVTLIITAAKLLRSSIFFKSCQKVGEVLDLGGSLKPWEQKKVAEERFSDLLTNAGLEMEADARREFLDRVGFDTRLIVQELEKLKLYLHPNVVATVEDIRAICSVGREAEIWDVTDAFGQRNPVTLMKALQSLAGEKSTPMIVATLIEKNIREMIVLREAYDRKWVYGGAGGAVGWAASLPPSAPMLLNSLGVSPKTMNGWALRKKLPFALNYTLNELRIARYWILKLREELVSTDIPPLQQVETTLLRILARRAKPAAGGR